MTRTDPHRHSPSLPSAAVACLLLAAGFVNAAAPPTPPGDPDRFTIHKGRLVWCERDPEAMNPAAHYAPVDGTGASISTWLRYATRYSVQYRVAHDTLWVVSQDSVFDDNDTRDCMDRHPLRDVVTNARRDAAKPDSQST